MPLFLKHILNHAEIIIPLAVLAIDLLIGDPQSWKWHPVRLLGRFAGYLEFHCRIWFPMNQFHAGVAAAILLLATTVLSAFYVTNLLNALLPHTLYLLCCIFLCYFCIAVRDMVKHSRDVLRELRRHDIAQARSRLSMIVGRDTDNLDEKEISRATVESVAESFSDSFIAPMFYIFLGIYLGGASGAVSGAFLYRAVNTLDSMFGYKNERYAEFGWLSAKLDDVVNFIPARLSVLFISSGAFFCGLSSSNALRTALNDGNHHASPNSGFPEAAFAGALSVQLGGDNYYGGLVRTSAKIGQPHLQLTTSTIQQANRLYIASSAVTSFTLSAILWLL